MSHRQSSPSAQRTGDPDSFARCHDALTATIAELREEIFKLHPHVLDHVGLGAALQQVAERHARDGAVRVMVEIDPHATSAHRQVLFSLGRELIANAARHANATEIRVRLSRGEDDVTLEVTDDGSGVPKGRVQQALRDGHIGLAEISERVAALSGRLEITTSAEAGTRMRVTLPARRADDREISGWGTAGDMHPVPKETPLGGQTTPLARGTL